MKTLLALLSLACATPSHADICTPGPEYDKKKCESRESIRAIKCRDNPAKCAETAPQKPISTEAEREEKRRLVEGKNTEQGEPLVDGASLPEQTEDGASPTEPTEDGVQPRPSGRRASPASSPEKPPDSPAPPPAQSVDQRRPAAAVKRATKLGEALTKGMREVEDLPAGDAAGKPAAPASAGVPDHPPTQAPDFANPRSMNDLFLASASGFAGSFTELGLKVGRSPSGAQGILRRDGTPASQDELARLSRHIAAEPLALMQRPDFFQVFPREDFGALKQEYVSSAEKHGDAFKDIALSRGERDFLHSQSCSRLSGACNPRTRKLSYKRGDYVPPEDLGAIWAAIKAEGDDPNSKYNLAAAEDAAPAPTRTTLGLVERMKKLMGGFGEMFSASVSAQVQAPSGNSEAPFFAFKPAASAGSLSQQASGSLSPGRSVASREQALPTILPEGATAPRVDDAARRRGLIWLAAAIAAALALLIARLKNR